MTPNERGYFFPAEWHPHVATWITFPHNDHSWQGDKLANMYPEYFRLIHAISQGEQVHINCHSNELKDFIENENLNDNERKLGYALIDLFDNYESIFSGADNNKFNKNVILLSLREMTNLSTKEIRSSIKRFKKLYILIQSKMKTD